MSVKHKVVLEEPTTRFFFLNFLNFFFDFLIMYKSQVTNKLIEMVHRYSILLCADDDCGLEIAGRDYQG
jgi:hypothetical protein